MDLFEKASRLKLRFASVVGPLSVEQLWDLPITTKAKNAADLAGIARNLNQQLKASSDDDLPFLSTGKKADSDTQLAFDIVRHVVEAKQAEAAKAAETASNREKKQQILALIAAKEIEEQAGKSLEDLRKLAAEL
jgi:superfamily I DNA and/or RNA helicase